MEESFQNELQRIYKKSLDHQNQKKIEELREIELKEESKVVQLPVWPEAIRAVPNSILRGSLFAAISPSSSQYLEKKSLINTDSLVIRYTGKQLNQSDLKVWEYALHLSRKQNLGFNIVFRAWSFLTSIGRTTSKRDYKWLDDTINKLSSCTVQITHDEKTYGGSLIDEFYRDEVTKEYTIVINPKIARLYNAGHTYCSWENKRKIGGKKYLAQWLYGYISSHAKFYPHKITTLKERSGSQTKCQRSFKQNLSNALKHLMAIELISNFYFCEKNLVHIEVKPSKSQEKYLSSQ